jgi:hypothetical protein
MDGNPCVTMGQRFDIGSDVLTDGCDVITTGIAPLPSGTSRLPAAVLK